MPGSVLSIFRPKITSSHRSPKITWTRFGRHTRICLNPCLFIAVPELIELAGLSNILSSGFLTRVESWGKGGKPELRDYSSPLYYPKFAFSTKEFCWFLVLSIVFLVNPYRSGRSLFRSCRVSLVEQCLINLFSDRRLCGMSCYCLQS